MQANRRAATSFAVVLPAVLVLQACAIAPPTGPSVAAMPAQGKSFEQFRADDAVCRQFASGQIGGVSPAQAANQSVAGSAVVGTVLGAAAGAAIGAATGNAGAGAAIGAGSGAVLGTATGLSAGQYSAGEMQRRYDIGYIQCMSAKGESVPQLPAYPYGYAYPYSYYGPGYYGPAYYPSWYDPFYVRFGYRHGYYYRR